MLRPLTALSCLPIVLLSACDVLGDLSGEAPEPAIDLAVAPDPAPATNFLADTVLYRCGFRELEVGRDGDILVISFDGERIRLAPDVAASGVKYVAPEDPETFFWMKDDRATFAFAGRQDPECAKIDPNKAAPTVTTPFRARGSEPGWTLTIGAGAIRYQGDYGETDIMTPRPKPETYAGTLIYRTKEPRLVVRIVDETCTDAATGMPYPYGVQVIANGKSVSGCGGDPKQLLVGAPWVVTAIAGEPVAEGARVTLSFGDDGRVSGDSLCNSYSAAFRLSGEGLSVGPVAATKKACAAPLMKQEQTLFDLIGRTTRFEVSAGRTLQLHTDDGTAISARRD